jgi:DNA-binding protein
LDTVKLLVSNKANVKIKNRGEEITGNIEIVKFLLSKGTDVNIKDINKFIALDLGIQT